MSTGVNSYLIEVSGGGNLKTKGKSSHWQLLLMTRVGFEPGQC